MENRNFKSDNRSDNYEPAIPRVFSCPSIISFHLAKACDHAGLGASGEYIFNNTNDNQPSTGQFIILDCEFLFDLPIYERYRRADNARILARRLASRWDKETIMFGQIPSLRPSTAKREQSSEQP